MQKKLLVLFILLTSVLLANQRDFSLNYQIPEQLIFSGPASGFSDTGHIDVQNTGTEEDTYSVAAIIDEGPASLATLCFRGVCIGPTGDLTIAPEEDNYIYASVYPTGTGVIKFHVEITSENIEPIRIDFTYITNDIDLLYVDADGGTASEAKIVPVLERANGLTWAKWDKSICTPTAEDIFSNVLWVAEDQTLDGNDISWLTNRLDNDNNVVISGNNIAEGLIGVNTTFASNYLHATFSQNLEYNQVNGIAGDDITNNTALVLQNIERDTVTPVNGGTAIFDIEGSNQKAGVRANHGGAKVVFCSFDFSNIINITERANFIANSLYWFELAFVDAEDEINPVIDTFAISNYPNPFNPSTKLKYNLGKETKGLIQIFNVKGQKVNAFNVNKKIGVVNWNGTDFKGNNVSSGTYFYKLQTKSKKQIKKMLLLK